MILVIAEVIPLIIVWKVLVVVDRVLVLMIGAEEVTPFTILVKVFVVDIKILVVVGIGPIISSQEALVPTRFPLASEDKH